MFPDKGPEVAEQCRIKRLLHDGNTAWEQLTAGGEEREIVFSPQARYVAVGMHDGVVAVWDVATLPHCNLMLGRPPDLCHNSDGEWHYTNVVVGISWSTGADKLLVSYQQTMTKPKELRTAYYISKWDLSTAKIDIFMKIDGSIGTAQLSPADANVCAYCLGSTTLIIQNLQDVSQKKGILIDSSAIIQAQKNAAVAGGGNISSEVGGGEGEEASSVVSAGQRKEVNKVGQCCFGQGGKVLYVALWRRVTKFEVADVMEVKELKRTEDVMNLYANIHKLRLDPTEQILMVFTNRAAHMLETESLAAAEPLGDFGALKLEWGSWGIGPDRDGPNAQLLVIGVPTAFSRDNVQERLFIWRIKDMEDVDEDNLPHCEATPDIQPGFANGLRSLELCGRRAIMMGINVEDNNLLLRREKFTTTFPGAMYEPGYTILESNRPYLEAEDELDKLPPGVLPMIVSTPVYDESEDVDIESLEIPHMGPDTIKAARATMVEEVTFPIVINPNSNRQGKGSTDEDEDGGESEEEEIGGLPDILPMPAALLKRRKQSISMRKYMEKPKKVTEALIEEGKERMRKALRRELEACDRPVGVASTSPGGSRGGTTSSSTSLKKKKSSTSSNSRMLAADPGAAVLAGEQDFSPMMLGFPPPPSPPLPPTMPSYLSVASSGSGGSYYPHLDMGGGLGGQPDAWVGGMPPFMQPFPEQGGGGGVSAYPYATGGGGGGGVPPLMHEELV